MRQVYWYRCNPFILLVKSATHSSGKSYPKTAVVSNAKRKSLTVATVRLCYLYFYYNCFVEIVGHRQFSEGVKNARQFLERIHHRRYEERQGSRPSRADCEGTTMGAKPTVTLLVLLWLASAASSQTPSSKAHFVGSESCRACHVKLYEGWKQTRMANVVRDPKMHPEAVLGDFVHPDPNRPFDLSQVAFIYGSRWKQRYFAKRGDDYYPLPAQCGHQEQEV